MQATVSHQNNRVIVKTRQLNLSFRTATMTAREKPTYCVYNVDHEVMLFSLYPTTSYHTALIAHQNYRQYLL